MARHAPKSKKAERARAAPAGGGFAMLLQQHQANAVDSLLRLLLDPLASLLTWAVIGIALALPLCLLLLLQNLQQFGADIDEVGTVSLYMSPALTASDLEKIQSDLQQRSDVARVELITAVAALAEFEEASGFGGALEGLDENPLPPVFLVTPAVDTPEGAGALHAALWEVSGVDYAQLDLQWLQRLSAMLRLATRLALMLAAMMALGVVLAIGNTVRLAIENRRAEIVVVKLVGGTDAYVARPFLYAGLWYGVGGGVIAVVLVALALWGLQGPVAALMSTYDSSFRLIGLGLSNSFLVLAGAGLLGWLGAWVSVLRHLRAIEPR